MSPKKNNNIQACQQILSELARFGMNEIVYCAGSRNAPFVKLLGELENTRIYSFFEERSAAFFALGRCRALQKPVAVITTSGTAAAELLPACIEAFYSGVPLILITADRPKRLRFTGAPQCIDQTKIMSSFVEQSFDLENSNLSLDDWSLSAPLHINVCLDEPLIDSQIMPWRLPASQAVSVGKPHSPQFTDNIAQMNSAVVSAERPLIVLGGLDGSEEIKAATKICLNLQWPIYAEASSGLRESVELKALLLKGGEQLTSHLFKKLKFDLILRLGSVPTTRLWRDLEEARDQVKVLSISPLNFSGLSESLFVQCRLTDFVKYIDWHTSKAQQAWQKSLSGRDAELSALTESLYEKYPLAEPSFVRNLSEQVKTDELVYIGNSLPIREWDLAASVQKPIQVFANRGANGIDGQLSTYLGLTAHSKNRSWCIIGDLTALYDLTAPWVLKSLSLKNHIFVIINNGGGQIFRRIYNNPLFENNHDLDFSHWAKMWDLDYQCMKDKTFVEKISGPCVIEIVPDADQTKNFWIEHSELIKTL